MSDSTATSSAPKLVVFDCDSTLSSIEGVDELARAGGEETFRAVEAMTNDAMDGRLAVEAVFGRRLEIIQPTRDLVAQVGQQYIDTMEPTALATVQRLRELGWTAIILSGGFRPAIRPLADLLGIERVEAVDLYFDDAGDYTGYDETYPTTRSGGKPEVIAQLKADFKPSRIVMVGDGVSDLETKAAVDLFVGFGGVVTRDKVRAEADQFIRRLDELLTILD